MGQSTADEWQQSQRWRCQGIGELLVRVLYQAHRPSETTIIPMLNAIYDCHRCNMVATYEVDSEQLSKIRVSLALPPGGLEPVDQQLMDGTRITGEQVGYFVSSRE